MEDLKRKIYQAYGRQDMEPGSELSIRILDSNLKIQAIDWKDAINELFKYCYPCSEQQASDQELLALWKAYKIEMELQYFREVEERLEFVEALIEQKGYEYFLAYLEVEAKVHIDKKMRKSNAIKILLKDFKQSIIDVLIDSICRKVRYGVIKLEYLNSEYLYEQLQWEIARMQEDAEYSTYLMMSDTAFAAWLVKDKERRIVVGLRAREENTSAKVANRTVNVLLGNIGRFAYQNPFISGLMYLAIYIWLCIWLGFWLTLLIITIWNVVLVLNLQEGNMTKKEILTFNDFA